MDLTNTDATIERMRTYIAECEKLAADAEDGHEIAKHMNNMRPAIALLHECLAKREAAGQDNEDPAAVERKALEFLRGRGWKCTGPGEDGR